MQKNKPFLCGIGFHNWKFSHDTGINEYYECKRCNERKVEFSSFDNYQPIDENWLNNQNNICYKTNEPCKYNCNGLCKESC